MMLSYLTDPIIFVDKHLTQRSVSHGHSSALQSCMFVFCSTGHPENNVDTHTVGMGLVGPFLIFNKLKKGNLPKSPNFPPTHWFEHVCVPPPQVTEHFPKSVHFPTTEIHNYFISISASNNKSHRQQITVDGLFCDFRDRNFKN